MTTPRDAIGLSERLRQWVTDWDGSQMQDGEPPRDGIHCDIIREAATALDALQGEISQWANEVARYKAYAEKFDEENAALQARVEELERIERNRDMWKGQCERQAEQLTKLRQQRDEAYERANNAENDLRVLWSADQASIRICEYCDAWMTIEEAARVDDASLCPQEAYGSTKFPDEKCFKHRSWLIKEDQSAIRRLAAGTEKEGK